MQAATTSELNPRSYTPKALDYELDTIETVIKDNPELVVSLHGHDPIEPGPAGGGNCSAANRIVNAIPAVCEASAGIVTPLDLPAIHGGAQM